VISTAIKRGTAKKEWVEGAVSSMTTLNKLASEIAQQGKFEVHGMTDITGFGLIGHAREMALASSVSLTIHAGRVPVLDGAIECVRNGYFPGGLHANRDFAECAVEYAGNIEAENKTILFDPQTAGGLLISVAANTAPDLVRTLNHNSIPAAVIGEVSNAGKPLISVHP
jgi:selenide,water dikinase